MNDLIERYGFAGRRGVVTGASRGMGRATTELLVRAGATVVGVARGVDDLSSLAADLASAEGAFLPLGVDLSDPEAPSIVREAVSDTVGEGLDFLVNNAGVLAAGPAGSNAVTEWDTVLAVNLRSVATLSAALCDKLAAGDDSAIVNVTSIQAVIGMAGRSLYAASKGGVDALTRSLAIEFAPRGVRVNAVCPGPVLTPLSEKVFADPELRKRVEATIPLGRFGMPDDIALCIAFLASRASSYMTGHSMVVDGGRTIS